MTGSGFATGKAAAPAKKAAATGNAAPPPERRGFVERAAKDLKDTVTNVPRGLVAMPKAMFTDLNSTFNPASAAWQEGPRNGESFADFYMRTRPFTGGLAQSLKTTSVRLGQGAASLKPGGLKPSETRLAKDYSERPVSSLVEDAANLSIIFGPIASGLGKTAEAATAAGKARTGTALGSVATKAGKVAEVGNKVAAAPLKPFELAASKVVGPAAKGAYLKAAESEGRVGQVLRSARLDPASRATRQTLFEGQEKLSEGIGRQTALAQRLERILPDVDEQAAHFIVGEGEAAALAKARSVLPKEDFERFATGRYGNTATLRAINLAADVAEGKAPELAKRIDEALAIGKESPGGRAERLDAYLEGPSSRAFQTGYDADPIRMQEATERAMKPLPKAQREAARLRAKADEARAKLIEADADVTATAEARAGRAAQLAAERQRALLQRQAERAAARAAEAADRLTSLQDLAEASKVAPPAKAAEQAALDRIARAGGRQALANHEMVTGERRILPSFAKMSSAGEQISAAGERFADAARRNGGMGRGQAVERAAQAERIARLESRRAGSLAAKAASVEERPVAARPVFGEGRRLGQLETRARVLENTARSAEARVGALRQRVTTAAAKTAASVEAAPARLRPMLEVNRAAVKEIERHADTLRAAGDTASADVVARAAQEIPVTRQALKAQGVDVDHFIHIRVGDKPLGGGSQELTLPKVRKTRAQKQRKGSAEFDRTFRAQAQAEIDELRGGIARETAKKIESLPFARKFATPAEAAEAGYVAWDPKNIFEKNPAPRPGAVYIPEQVFKSFRSYFNDPKWDQMLGVVYDKPLRAWKTAVLPLSPSWQVGNIVGNLTLATFGAGVGPISLAKAMAEAVREYRASGPKGARTMPGPRRLYTSGATFAEFDYLRGAGTKTARSRLGRAAEPLTNAAGGFVRKSYALNGFVDDFGRSAVFLAKKAEGLTEEAALRESLKAMGDFSRMTPFERRVAKRIVPFYAWQRHMTQLAFRLPVEHPLRVAWTLRLADEFGQPDSDLAALPSFMRGAIPLPGGKLLGTSSLFPFGDAGKILTPAGMRQSLSPLLKIPAERATGLNFFTGRPFTRPPGTGKVDEFGRELPTPPSLSTHLASQVPQKRLLDAITGRSKVIRYDSGDKVLTGSGPIPSDRPRNEAVLRWAGLPISERAAAVEQAKRAEEAKAKLRKSAENYRRRQRQS